MTDVVAETMRAFVLTAHGDLDCLQYRTDFPKPRAAAGEVLIRVRACGLNNTDVNTRIGWYSKSVTAATDSKGAGGTGGDSGDASWGGAAIAFPRVQGGDVCGIVEAAGSGVDTALIGRRVLVDPCLRCAHNAADINAYAYLGSERDGGFAEYTAVPAHAVHPINTTLSDAECATFAIAYLTAENMLNRAGVNADDTVLITGASGGVGSALIQLARRRGARVLAMCANEKAERVRAIGADATIPRAGDYLPKLINDAMGANTAISVVADVVGGAMFPAIIDTLTRGGRYVTSGAIAGPIVSLDLRTLYLRDLSFFGATYSPEGTFASIVTYIEKGEIRPLLAATYPLAQLHKAQTQFIAKKHIGNIVVTPDSDTEN